MLGRLLHGHQQTDPKHRVKAQEHRHDVTVPAKPPGVPQIVEQEIAPKRNKTSPPTPTLPVRRAHASYRPPFCAMQGYCHLFTSDCVILYSPLCPVSPET